MEKFEKEIEKAEQLILNDLDVIRSEYKEKGYFIMNSYFSPAFCENVRSRMDQFEDEVEVSDEKMTDKQYGYAETEMRIWNSEKRDDLLANYNAFCDRISSKIFNTEMKAFNLLSMRNRPLDKTQLAEFKGRWHLDSLTDQFKVILFLTKTTEKSGPFEFIPGTQKKSFKNKLLVQGKLITLKDLLSGTRAYQKLADDYINNILKGKPSKRAIVPEGSLVFMNTSAIHRAKPCEEMGRYALFSYYK